MKEKNTIDMVMAKAGSLVNEANGELAESSRDLCSFKVPVFSVGYDPMSVILRSGDQIVGAFTRSGSPDDLLDKLAGKIDSEKIGAHVMIDIGRLVDRANIELGKATRDSYPYTLDDVRMTFDSDDLSVFVRSGRTTVCAVVKSRYPEETVREIGRRINDRVEDLRDAISRRRNSRDEADQLVDESRKMDASIADDVSSGISLERSRHSLCLIDESAGKAIVDAARAAVNKANAHPFIGLSSDAARLHVKGFTCGFVITVGNGCDLSSSADDPKGGSYIPRGRPVMVTWFPKAGGARAVESMITFIRQEIDAIDESRKLYFSGIMHEMDRERRLREIGYRYSRINHDLDHIDDPEFMEGAVDMERIAATM